MCNRTQNVAIWGLIALFLTNQMAGNTSDFKMNVIKSVILSCYDHQIKRPIKFVVLIRMTNQIFL